MTRRIIFFTLVIPVTYFLFVLFGWFFYLMCHGNPTFFIPLPVLMTIFLAGTLLISRATLKYFKIYNRLNFCLASIEIAAVYIFLLVKLH
jgi:hypothetical protein